MSNTTIIILIVVLFLVFGGGRRLLLEKTTVGVVSHILTLYICGGHEGAFGGEVCPEEQASGSLMDREGGFVGE